MTTQGAEQFYAVQPDHCNGWWVVSTDPDGYNTIDESGDGGFEQATAIRIAASLNSASALLADRDRLADEVARLTAGLTEAMYLTQEALTAEEMRGNAERQALRAEIARLTAERDGQYDENVHRIAEQARVEAERDAALKQVRVFVTAQNACLAALEPQPITVQDAARVLLTALERAQIDIATLKLFFNGQPVTAMRAIAEGRSK